MLQTWEAHFDNHNRASFFSLCIINAMKTLKMNLSFSLPINQTQTLHPETPGILPGYFSLPLPQIKSLCPEYT